MRFEHPNVYGVAPLNSGLLHLHNASESSLTLGTALREHKMMCFKYTLVKSAVNNNRLLINTPITVRRSLTCFPSRSQLLR